MAIPWTTTRDALLTASATAKGDDRRAARELAAELTTSGTRYDALAPDFEPVTATTYAAAWAAQVQTAAAAAVRASRALEAATPGAIPWTPADTTDTTAASDLTSPVVASVLFDSAGTVLPLTSPFGVVEVRAAFSGAEGNELAVTLAPDPGPDLAGRVVVYLRGRATHTEHCSARVRGERLTAPSRGSVIVTYPTNRALWPTVASPASLAGGAGSSVPAVLARCATSVRGAPASMALRASRVRELAAELEAVWGCRPVNGRAPTNLAGGAEGPALERRLAAAVERGEELRAYLSAA